MLHFGYLLLLPAALGIMHLARRSTPKVAHIGGILAVLGLATLPGLLVTDYYDLALAQHLPRAQSVEIADSAMTWPAGVMLATTIAPMFFGLVTLMVAAVRAGVAHFWAPIAVAVGWILPFASGTGHRAGERGRGPDRRRADPDRRQGRPDERSDLGRVELRPHQAREGAEDGGRERRLTGEMAGVRGRGRPSPVTPAGSSSSPHPAYHPSRAGGVDLRMELDAPREAADAEALRAAASRPCVDLDGAGRRLDAVLVPVQGVRAGRNAARAPDRRRSPRSAPT